MVSEPIMVNIPSDPTNPSGTTASTGPVTSSPTPAIFTHPPFNPHIPISTKLTHNNFLTWKSHILPIINGYNLSTFLTSPPPNPTILTAAGQIQMNPDYLPWSNQDQLLLSWIRGSFFDSIQSQVVAATTSGELWHSLQQLFSSNSRARLFDLKSQLQNAKKGSHTCSEFLQQLRHIADELALAGAPQSDDDLTLAALNGLGSEYNAFVAATTATA